MWCHAAAFFSASGGKMNVQSACALNTRYNAGDTTDTSVFSLTIQTI
jgi:hypothetical protein